MFEKTKSLHLVSLFKSLLDSVISAYLYVLGIVVFIFAFGIQFDYRTLMFTYTFFILMLILSRILSILISMYKRGIYDKLYLLLKLIFSFVMIMKCYNQLDTVNPIQFVKNDSVYLTTSYFLIVFVMLIVGSKILSKLIKSMFERLYHDHPEMFHLKNITYVYSEISGNLLHELYLYELKGISFFEEAHLDVKRSNDDKVKLEPIINGINVTVKEEPRSEEIVIIKDFETEEKS